MGQEIERKYLTKGEFREMASSSTRITQGYLSSNAERNVRVRIRDDKGYLTVKGIGSESGATRFEWEKEIPVEDVQELLKICEPGIIDKTRYLVEFGGHTFEVDEFYGDNEGLVMAEVELESEDEEIQKPDWLGDEVTGDKRYYNAMLTKHPFKSL
jgi:adenylate cyclase